MTRKAAEGVHAGLEYYGEHGPIHHTLPHNERTHYLHGVVDIEKKGWDTHFGVGRGLESAAIPGWRRRSSPFRSSSRKWVMPGLAEFALQHAFTHAQTASQFPHVARKTGHQVWRTLCYT